MPRQREFDPNEALQTAIELFWEKGYYDSSVDEVVKRSGVAKYGIYGTFGTKRELFMKALNQYAGDRHRDIQRPIRNPDASLPEIRAFFRQAPGMLTQENTRRGCLICNTGVELGNRDAEINAFVNDFFSDIARVMQGCLERSIVKGQIAAPEDVAGLATYLATEFRTALMLAASGVSRRQIEKHLGIALRVLE
ncbi:MAG: TetR family transcriptional regulator [Gammaproteobacteria bacterium]|nr:MAG: TetR family transcriptional regulator [Gammaproteobacteria bacterium]